MDYRNLDFYDVDLTKLVIDMRQKTAQERAEKRRLWRDIETTRKTDRYHLVRSFAIKLGMLPVAIKQTLPQLRPTHHDRSHNATGSAPIESN